MGQKPRLMVIFFRTEYGNEPVKEWLSRLTREEKKVIGIDIKTVQFGWPMGMPLIRKLDKDLWEIRSRLKNRITRIIFTVIENKMVLLHGMFKKSNKIPKSDLNLAKIRLNQIKGIKNGQ